MRFDWQNSQNEIRTLRSHNTKDFPHPTEKGKRIKIQYGVLLHAYTDKGFEDIDKELPDCSFPEGKELTSISSNYFIMNLPDWGKAQVENGGKVVRIFDKKNVSIFRYSNPIVIEKGKAPYKVIDGKGKKLRDAFSSRETLNPDEKLVNSEAVDEGTYEVEGNKLYLKLSPTLKNTFPLQAYDATDTASTNNKDAYVQDAFPTTNYGSDESMYAGCYTTPKIFHSFIHFTLSAGSGTISAVQLNLYSTGVAGTPTIQVHELSRSDWVEDEVTWDIYKTGSNWTVGGGDFSATIVDSIVPTASQYNAWDLGAGATNPISGLTWGSEVHLFLKGSVENGTSNYTQMNSKDHASNKPYIEITYSAAQDYPIGITANLSLSPSLSRSFAFDRGISPNLSLTASVSRVFGRLRTTASNLSLAASVSRAIAIVRGISLNLFIGFTRDTIVAEDASTMPGFTRCHGLAYYDGYIYGVSRTSPGVVFKASASDLSSSSTLTPQHNSTDATELMEIIEAGGYLWTVDAADWVYKIDPSSFTVSATLELSIAVTSADGSLCADGTYVYIGGFGDVAKVQISDCTEADYGTIDVAQAFHAIAQYGDYVFAYNPGGKKLYKVAKSDLSLDSTSAAATNQGSDDIAIDDTYVYVPNEYGSGGIARFAQGDLSISELAGGISMGLSYGCYLVNDGEDDRLLVLDYGSNYIWVLSTPGCTLVKRNSLSGLGTSDSINELTEDGTNVYLSQWVTSGNTPLASFALSDVFASCIDRTVAYNRSSSPSLSLTAAVSKIRGWIVSTASNLNLTTTISRAITYTRATVSNLSLAASIVATTIQDYLITIIANLSLATNVVRTVAWTRAIASNLSLAASISRVIAYARSSPSNLSLTATVSKLRGWLVTTSANLGLTTTVSRAVAWARATSSSLSLAASIIIEGIQEYLVTITANLSLATNVVRSWTHTVATSSALSLTATVLKAWGRTVTTSSNLILTTTISRIQGYYKAITTSLALTTTISRVVAYARATSSSLSLTAIMFKGRKLVIRVITSQYRAMKVITSQSKIINILTMQYRKIRALLLGE